jgi:hypothetical protein
MESVGEAVVSSIERCYPKMAQIRTINCVSKSSKFWNIYNVKNNIYKAKIIRKHSTQRDVSKAQYKTIMVGL